jgi:hypothetical protein
MQRSISALLVIVLLVLLIMSLGCGKKTPEPADYNSDASGKKSRANIEQGADTSEIPEWFLRPPKDPDYLYAAATAQSTDLGFASMDAQKEGRVDIAGQIQTRVMAMFKRFRQEVGAGEDAELNALSEAISKEVVAEAINGCRPIEKKLVKEGSMTYRFYVLMEMPIGLANAALMKKVRANNNMYTHIRASEAFKELEEEVARYERERKEQNQ